MLASHMGVVRLMDMMNEREAIRNEALLLLNRLTRDSVDIQKIAAFEGAFERLFNIVRCMHPQVWAGTLVCSLRGPVAATDILLASVPRLCRNMSAFHEPCSCFAS